MYTTILKHVNQLIILTEKEQDYFKSILFPVEIAKRKKLLKPSRFVKHEYFVIKGCLIGFEPQLYHIKASQCREAFYRIN